MMKLVFASFTLACVALAQDVLEAVELDQDLVQLDEINESDNLRALGPTYTLQYCIEYFLTSANEECAQYCPPNQSRTTLTTKSCGSECSKNISKQECTKQCQAAANAALDTGAPCACHIPDFYESFVTGAIVQSCTLIG
eukprot:GHVN01022545.1.p1 GENE.GHVN01022545.1~~GHVN01022545.1.p1  ORF type:complete len:140 (+),score=10.08 GHVN01022545.1:405-824(+)